MIRYIFPFLLMIGFATGASAFSFEDQDCLRGVLSQCQTTVFTETGLQSCNETEAYWSARWDIEEYCGTYDENSGHGLDGTVPFGYDKLDHTRTPSGSCHDPNGGNGIGTRHKITLRATCYHPEY